MYLFFHNSTIMNVMSFDPSFSFFSLSPSLSVKPYFQVFLFLWWPLHFIRIACMSISMGSFTGVKTMNQWGIRGPSLRKLSISPLWGLSTTHPSVQEGWWAPHLVLVFVSAYCCCDLGERRTELCNLGKETSLNVLSSVLRKKDVTD